MKLFGIEISQKMLIGIIAGIVVVGAGITTGVIWINNKDNQPQSKEEEKEEVKELKLKNNLTVEVNSQVNLLSFVSEDNEVVIISEDEIIDTTTLGEKEVTIEYGHSLLNMAIQKKFKINVVDTQKPIIEYQKEINTNVGTPIDLLKDVKVSDNSKEEIKATVEGEYDFNQEGTYHLKYIAIDSSNNKAEEEVTLNVNKSACNLKKGAWSTSKPDNCEYTTKDIVWRYQMIMDTDGNERWAWTVDFIFEGIGAGSAEPKDITDNRYDVYPYLSTEPKETYTDNQEHEKTVTVYITK